MSMCRILAIKPSIYTTGRIVTLVSSSLQAQWAVKAIVSTTLQ